MIASTVPRLCHGSLRNFLLPSTHLHQTILFSTQNSNPSDQPDATTKPEKKLSTRMEEFQKKLREKTPIGKLDEIEGAHPYQEKEPLKKWPNNTNPHTGERNGPAGPEPTRYGDWERKGRVSDF